MKMMKATDFASLVDPCRRVAPFDVYGCEHGLSSVTDVLIAPRSGLSGTQGKDWLILSKA
jgi:hypothetical protein